MPTDEGIRDLIAALKALPPGHPLENLLREAPDFRQEAALADALLHPQDRAYSVPQLFDFIERGGLTFGRWVKQAPYSPALWRHGKDPAGCPDGTASLGRAVCRCRTVSGHDGSSQRGCCTETITLASPQPVSFAGDAWLGYVPIRMSDTICVQERLPPGAAAVLINQTHTYRDLFMPIDATEKRLFDAIDGNRRIGDIVERTLPSSPQGPQLDMARTFFERLWWYDQVVFDTSGTTSRQPGICAELAVNDSTGRALDTVLTRDRAWRRSRSSRSRSTPNQGNPQ